MESFDQSCIHSRAHGLTTQSTKRGALMSELRLENICVSYDDRPILKNLSCTLKSGDVVALLGPNGAGKSTLMNIISGKIKAQKGSTFVVRENKELESVEVKNTDIRAPQFRSLDQPSVLKKLGKSIIGLLGKKEDQEE